nr:hypothetical protein [Tanacetum cinerariifolium]
MTKKAMDTLDGCRMRQFSNHIDFGFVNLNPILRDLMAEDDALFDHKVTLLPIQKKNPTEQSRLGIFLSKEIFEGGMIRIHNDFVHNEDCTYSKVACIAHKLKGKSQSRAIKIGASLNFLLSV